jgi:hypothetical protein
VYWCSVVLLFRFRWWLLVLACMGYIIFFIEFSILPFKLKESDDCDLACVRLAKWDQSFRGQNLFSVSRLKLKIRCKGFSRILLIVNVCLCFLVHVPGCMLCMSYHVLGFVCC